MEANQSKELNDAIESILRKFEKETGFKIDGIEINRVYIPSGLRNSISVLNNISVKISS